jgi:hypothetical protein
MRDRPHDVLTIALQILDRLNTSMSFWMSRHDEAKRQTLERQGYKVISVVPAHLASRAAFNVLIDEVRRHLGLRIRPRVRDFDRRQAALFREFELVQR